MLLSIIKDRVRAS